jgi:hypothetical protein
LPRIPSMPTLDELLAQLPDEYDDTKRAIRAAFAELGMSAVDGLLPGHTFPPESLTKRVPPERRPLTRKSVEDVARGQNDPLISRLLATIEQRDRIYAAIQTDAADPAGTYRGVDRSSRSREGVAGEDRRAHPSINSSVALSASQIGPAFSTFNPPQNHCFPSEALSISIPWFPPPPSMETRPPL